MMIQASLPAWFYRMSGWLLIVSALSMTAVQYVHLEDVPTGLGQMDYFVDVAVWTHIALFVANGLFMLGFIGLYVRQAEKLKWWGWLSFPMLFGFVFIDTLHAPLQIFDYPVFFKDITTEAQLQEAVDLVNEISYRVGPGMFLMAMLMPFILIGTILMGSSMLKARIVPRWVSIVNLCTIPLILLPYGPVTKYVFPLQFLVFALYGGFLAFEKRRGAAPAIGPDASASVQ